MITLRKLTAKLPAVREWLSAAGAEVLEPTNPYEVLRFRAGGATSVVYKNDRGNLTFTGESAKAVGAFFSAGSWRAAAATPREKVSPTVKTIRMRDGDGCFLCAFPVSSKEESVDHLVPLTAKGPNHISNLVLMHRDCNQFCGAMSAPEKIAMHVESQLALRYLARNKT